MNFDSTPSFRTSDEKLFRNATLPRSRNALTGNYARGAHPPFYGISQLTFTLQKCLEAEPLYSVYGNRKISGIYDELYAASDIVRPSVNGIDLSHTSASEVYSLPSGRESNKIETSKSEQEESSLNNHQPPSLSSSEKNINPTLDITDNVQLEMDSDLHDESNDLTNGELIVDEKAPSLKEFHDDQEHSPIEYNQESNVDGDAINENPISAEEVIVNSNNDVVIDAEQLIENENEEV